MMSDLYGYSNSSVSSLGSSVPRQVDTMPVLTNDGTWRLFEMHAEERFRQMGAAGNACLTGINRDPQYPGMFDMLKNADGTPHANISRFDQIPASGTTDAVLSSKGKDEYKKAVEGFDKDKARFQRDGNNQLSDFFLRYLSKDIKMSLAVHKGWIAACNAPIADNFTKWKILKSIYSHGTAKSKNNKFREYLSLTQGSDSYPVFAEKVNNGAITMAYNFGSSKHPGYIAMEDVKMLVFLTGLHQVDFKFFLDKWYVDNPVGTKMTVDEVMDQVSTYAREHVSEPSAAQYAVSLVANTPVIKCSSCSVPIPYVLSERGHPRSKCQPCYRKFLSELKTTKMAKVSHAIKPGPVVTRLSQAEKTAARATIAASPPGAAPSPGDWTRRIPIIDDPDSESEDD